MITDEIIHFPLNTTNNTIELFTKLLLANNCTKFYSNGETSINECTQSKCRLNLKYLGWHGWGTSTDTPTITVLDFIPKYSIKPKLIYNFKL